LLQQDYQLFVEQKIVVIDQLVYVVEEHQKQDQVYIYQLQLKHLKQLVAIKELTPIFNLKNRKTSKDLEIKKQTFGMVNSLTATRVISSNVSSSNGTLCA